jgi:hypothetical protein
MSKPNGVVERVRLEVVKAWNAKERRRDLDSRPRVEISGAPSWR